MMARARDEAGASLILALVFITVIGVVAAALASLGFTSQKAAAIHSDQRAMTNTLDSGLQAAIENRRVREPFGCGAAPTENPLVAELDPADTSRNVSVACAVPAGAAPPSQTQAELSFTAQMASPPACPAPQPPSINARVAFSTIGNADTGARIARTTSWKVVPTTCPPI